MKRSWLPGPVLVALMVPVVQAGEPVSNQRDRSGDRADRQTEKQPGRRAQNRQREKKPRIDPGQFPELPPLNKGRPVLPKLRGRIQAGPPVELQWKLRPGDVLFQELSIARRASHHIQGIDMATRLRYRVLSKFTVERRDGEGHLVVTQRVLASHLDDADEISQAMLADAVRKTVGSVYKIRLNANMEVVAFEGKEAKLRIAAGGQPFAGQAFLVTSLMDKDGWKEMAQVAFFQPNRPLRVGERWQQKLVHAWGPLGTWTGRVLYGYLGKDKQWHRIGYVHQLRHQPPDRAMKGLPFQVDQASFQPPRGQGIIYFDSHAGRVAGAEERFAVQGTLTVSLLGQKVPVQIREEQFFRMKLTDRDPWAAAEKGKPGQANR